MGELEVFPPELEDLAKEVGEFICYWGFKKIHGRIWTYIYLSKSPLDASQLMKRLGVSKALISLSLNDLLKFGVIFESDKSKRGTQTYAANPDVLDVILNVLRRREFQMLTTIEEGHKKIVSLSEESITRAHLHSNRIDSLGRMIQQAQNALCSLMELTTVDLTGWEKSAEKKTAAEETSSS